MSDEKPPLTLESTPAKKLTRAGYLHELMPGSPYEGIFATKIRAIKRWRQIGLAANPPKPPPLDDHVALVDWWVKHMSQRPPARLLELRARATSTPPPPTPAAIASPPPIENEAQPPPTAGTPPPSAPPVDRESLDLPAVIARQQRMLGDIGRSLELEMARGAAADESTLTLLGNRWDKAVERLRRLEDTHREHLEKSGASIPLARLRDELTPLVETIRHGVLSLLTNDLGVARPRALQLADTLFGEFRRTRFAPTPVPDPLPAQAA